MYIILHRYQPWLVQHATEYTTCNLCPSAASIYEHRLFTQKWYWPGALTNCRTSSSIRVTVLLSLIISMVNIWMRGSREFSRKIHNK